jgi:hypothetical protein
MQKCIGFQKEGRNERRKERKSERKGKKNKALWFF